MPTLQDVQTWQDRQVRGTDGEKIGKVREVYLDRDTDQPEWLAVTTGMFGRKASFVPIASAQTAGEEIVVPFSKEKVKDAPNIDEDGELSDAEERELYTYYGLEYGASAAATGHDTSGPNTDDAMTRSEEELVVGKTQRETGRARLRKYVVTEQVQTTVPVQREEVRVEREPITDGNVDQALDGPAISEEEHEVTLHAEEPVVEKRAVPKERVRLTKDTVTEEQTVGDEVRKERIDTDA